MRKSIWRKKCIWQILLRPGERENRLTRPVFPKQTILFLALLEICKANRLLPLNMLKKDTSTEFPGDFTYRRGNLKSQNDWVLISRMPLVMIVNKNTIHGNIYYQKKIQNVFGKKSTLMEIQDYCYQSRKHMRWIRRFSRK